MVGVAVDLDKRHIYFSSNGTSSSLELQLCGSFRVMPQRVFGFLKVPFEGFYTGFQGFLKLRLKDSLGLGGSINGFYEFSLLCGVTGLSSEGLR